MTQERDIAPELVEELVSFVRAASLQPHPLSQANALMMKAREIVAKFPDPDIEEARKVIVQSYGSCIDSTTGDGPPQVRAIRDGKGDGYWEMRAVLAAIKRGRALERGEA